MDIRVGSWRRHLAWIIPLAVTALLIAADSADAISAGLRSLVDSHASNIGDPWPTLAAARELRDGGRGHLYASFSPAGSSFIYPPIAAFVMSPLADLSYERAHLALSIVSRVAYVVCLGLAVAIAWGAGRVSAALVGVALGLAFYPLLRSVELNQATLLVSVFFGGAVLAALHGRQALAGVLIGLMAALKPQAILILPLLLWHSRRLSVAGLITAVGAGIVSIVYAGVSDHVDYVTRILPQLSVGYAFYPNQSWTGMVLRLAGEPFAAFALPSPSPGARVAAMALNLTTFAVAIVVLRTASRRSAARTPQTLASALCFAWLAVTLASPISWEHHYTPCIFAFALIIARARGWPLLACLLAAASFPLIASYVEVRSWTGMVGRAASSYCLFGGLLLAASFAFALTNRDASGRHEVAKV
jgi:alpha-1,2-mannosyltransferase